MSVFCLVNRPVSTEPIEAEGGRSPPTLDHMNSVVMSEFARNTAQVSVTVLLTYGTPAILRTGSLTPTGKEREDIQLTHRDTVNVAHR